MDTKKLSSLAGKVLLHPVTVFGGIAVGAYIGARHKPLAVPLGKLGDIYLALLQMCVLPIMMSAVMSSVGKLFRSGQARTYLVRLVLVFAVGILLASSIGVMAGIVGRPGRDLGREQKAALGTEILKAEVGDDAGAAPHERKNLLAFVLDLIPSNVFRSVTEGKSLPVLVFCLIVGAALGTLPSKNADVALSVIHASYEAVLKVITWLMYALPVGLCCLFAGQMARMGLQIFLTLLKLVLLLYGTSVLLLIAYAVVIWRRSGKSLLESLLALKSVLVVSVGTSSSLAAIPFALEGLHKNLGFEAQTSDLVVPLGITLNPHGNILHFALATVFMAQLYNVGLGAMDLLTIVPVAAVAGVAACGAPGLAGLAMLAIVLDLFGLPAGVALILLAAVDPVVDPVLTAVNVYGNCAATALVAKRTMPP